MKKLININIIAKEEVIIKPSNQPLKYIEIASFKSLSFSYGIYDDGWIVKTNNQVYQILDEDIDNYIVFLKILEQTPDKLLSKIREKIIELNKDLEIKDLFPIYNIMNLIFRMESSYWLNLCFDLLLEAVLYDNEIEVFSEKLLNNSKWITQELKHKILKYISRCKRNK